MQERAWSLYIFFYNHNYQGGTGKFIYMASLLDVKQLLLNMNDRKATQVPHTTRFTASLIAIYILFKLLSHSFHYSYS